MSINGMPFGIRYSAMVCHLIMHASEATIHPYSACTSACAIRVIMHALYYCACMVW